MTRDETIALFLECEAKRAESLAAGKSEDEAHEAAKAHWNAWAKALLAERKAMEGDGRWAAEIIPFRLEPKNAETRAWMKTAEADFSRCLFLVRGAEGTSEGGAPPVKSIQLEGDRADFRDFLFPGDARFESATFKGGASFESATFTVCAYFVSATFTGSAYFASANYASFVGATFTGYALFQGATFTGNTSFNSATFTSAYFVSATFEVGASFVSATFTGDAFFGGARFKQANFMLARFDYATFAGAEFGGRASFEAIRCERGFTMARARFDVVPDFIQAHFEEAPRLDNLEVVARIVARHPRPEQKEAKSWWLKRWQTLRYAGGAARTWPKRARRGIWRRLWRADRDIPSRWLALKRLAIQAHDTDRELEFHAREVRSQRFAGDWPLPLAFWQGKAWGGFFRFWFGIGYGFFSDFGRSIFRPFFFWFIGIVAFAAFYLSQTDVMHRDLALQEASYVSAAAQAGRYAMSNTVPCYTRPPTFTDQWRGNWGLWGTAIRVLPEQAIRGLSDELRSRTNARTEALHLAFRNALIAIDAGGDASYRIYGCLYGLVGNTPIVPGTVSAASAIQKLLSGVLIFLFGLALRNMLKMK